METLWSQWALVGATNKQESIAEVQQYTIITTRGLSLLKMLHSHILKKGWASLQDLP